MAERDAIEYRVPGASTFPAILAFMMLVGLMGLILTLTSGGPLWFVLAYLAIVGWNAFNFLVRFARSVSIKAGTLHWIGFLGSESVPLATVARLSVWFGGSVQVVETREGRKLRIPIMQGYRRFGEALADAVSGSQTDQRA
jgi:hypothetical protein